MLGSRVRFQPGDTEYGGWTSPDIYDRLSATEQFGFVGTADGVVSDSVIRGTGGNPVTVPVAAGVELEVRVGMPRGYTTVQTFRVRTAFEAS